MRASLGGNREKSRKKKDKIALQSTTTSEEKPPSWYWKSTWKRPRNGCKWSSKKQSWALKDSYNLSLVDWTVRVTQGNFIWKMEISSWDDHFKGGPTMMRKFTLECLIPWFICEILCRRWFVHHSFCFILTLRAKSNHVWKLPKSQLLYLAILFHWATKQQFLDVLIKKVAKPFRQIRREILPESVEERREQI